MKSKRPSSARFNRRYILFKGGKENAEKAIIEGIGFLGWAKASPEFLICDDNEKSILVVNREEINNIIACLALSSNNIEIIKISGTIKGLNLKKL